MVVAQVQHSLNLLDHFGRINIVVVYALSTFGVPNTCGCIRGLVGDNGDLIDMQLASFLFESFATTHFQTHMFFVFHTKNDCGWF